MNYKKIIIFVCVFTMIFSNLAYANPSELLEGEESQNSYLIGLHKDVLADEFKEQKLKDKKIKKIKTKNKEIIVAMLTETELLEVASNDEVLFVEENVVVEVASVDKPKKKEIEENDQLIPWGIDAISSELVHENGMDGKNIKVAILDTGISEHPDLKMKDGISFVESESFNDDDHGHGTHVAGTVAALDNEMGVVGVAPEVDFYGVKVLNEDGNGSYAQVIEGIQWAIDQKMDIISMSFGGQAYSRALHGVIQDADEEGILIIGAAGNAGEGTQTIQYPALFPEVISVGAVDENLERASYSSTGEELDLVAPGSDILSTLQNGEYGEMTGTSMAVPHVTGAAALIWSTDKKLSSEEIKNKLYNTATPLGDAHEYGYGLINVEKALGLIHEDELTEDDVVEEEETELDETTDEQTDETIDVEETEEFEEITEMPTPNIGIKGIPSKENVTVPQLNGDLLLITAYFDPSYMDQLDDEDLVQFIELDTELVNAKISDLSLEDYELLEELLPTAITQYRLDLDREAYIEELNTSQKKKLNVNRVAELNEMMSISALEEYTFTEFNSTYNFDIKSDQYVDSLYRTANRSVADIYLPGINGFDFILKRQYNSLDSKLMKPESRSGENYSIPFDTEEVKNGFIANGWSLNLPFLEIDRDIEGKIVHDINYLTTDSDGKEIYESSYVFDSDEPSFKMVFTVDDGSSYEFHLTDINGSPKMELIDYPYVNEVSLEVRANGYRQKFDFENGPDNYIDNMLGFDIEIYTLGIGNTLYDFDDQGRIIQKYSHINNMVINYEYVNNDIIITDKLDRTVKIYRDADLVVSKIEAKDSAGNIIEEINYETTKRTKTITYKEKTNDDHPNDLTTESISFWQLNTVKDGSGNVLETYDYYAIDSSTMADFNLILPTDGYRYYSSFQGRPLSRDENEEYGEWLAYWAEDGETYELGDIYDAQLYDFAELPYLLLKNINFNNGTTLQFVYDKYNPLWSVEHDGYDEVGIAEELRNTTRLFLDEFGLQHISFHAVNRVLYSYEEDSQSKVNYETYSNEHMDHGYNFKEYWKFDRYDNDRILGYTSRFGDKQTIKNVQDSTGETTFYHYGNHGKRFLLEFSWIRDSKESELLFSEDGTSYLSNTDVVTAYEYDDDYFRPSKIHQYSDQIPDYWDVVERFADRRIKFRYPLTQKNVQYPVLPVSSEQINMQTSTLEYDTYGEITTEIDPLGNVTMYEYDDENFHQLSKLTVNSVDGLTTYLKQVNYNDYMPDFTTETYTYQDPFEPSLQKTDVFKTDVQYDGKELLTSMDIYASGDQFDVEQLITEKDFTYTDDAKLKTETTKVTLEEGLSPISLTVQYDYDNDGNLREIIYPDTSEVEYDYDYLDRITSYSQVPVGGDIRTTTAGYLDDERKVTVNTPDGEQIESFYTPFGLNVKQVRKVNEVFRVMNEIESNDGIITDATKPYGNSELGTSYTYDNLNRVMSMEDAEGNITRYYYANTVQGADGYSTLQQTTKVVYPNGKEEISYFDVSGNLVKFVERDVNGNKERITTNQYSSLGQLLEASVTSEGKTQTNQYGYDGKGNLIFLEDDLGQTYKYVYNPLGQVVEYYINDKTEPEVTKTYNEVGWLLTETSPSGDQETYTYNNKGLIETFVDKKGQTFTYTYSPYNEVEHMTVTDNTGQEVLWEDYTYDPETRLPTELSNSEGQTLSYTYDEWKRLNTQEIAGNTYTFNYDDFDRLEALVYPDLKQVDYTHDNLSRIQNVSYDGQLMGDYDYTISTDGTSSSLNYEALSMGFQTDMNPFGEIISHEQKDTGSITWAESFGYDGLGNIESINQNGEISKYQYDDLNRIIQEDVVEGIQTYTYDEKGNRKTMEGTMKLPLGPREFTYNALNQLSTFKENDEVTTYQYYVGGLRATKESQDGDFTRYIYFQGNVIEELDQEGNPTARNIWGNQLLYREDMTSSLGGYYFYNGHGDVVKVIAGDGSKDVLKEYDYDIWGNVLTETSHETKTFDNPFLYTGEIYDEESGLIYLRARYYDPSMGRFITEDTYEGEINNPLSLNLYTYVHNNPLKYEDPSGHRIKGIDPSYFYFLYRYKSWGVANIVEAYFEEDINDEEFLHLTGIEFKEREKADSAGAISFEAGATANGAEREVAEQLAKIGYDVMHLKEKNDGSNGTRTPDYLVNGEFLFELKTLGGDNFNSNTGATNAAKGISQGANTIIIDAQKYGDDYNLIDIFDVVYMGVYYAQKNGYSIEDNTEIQIWTTDGIYYHNVGELEPEFNSNAIY
ncbi:S8 family serine peptidase [Chengkuizengella sp. SCS-71B]|uniref:S8 family serine peptidase n=1 Tax=Chengkuizengella sp. SCS-71B TaxID=3115290 RepID=UPI0032C22990